MNQQPRNRVEVAVAIAFWIAAIGIAFGAVALLLAALRMDWDSAAPWFVMVVQILLSFLTAIVCIALAAGFFLYFGRKINELKTSHEEGVKAVAQRTPTVVAAMILVADAVQVLVADSFRGGAVSTIAVSLVLLLGFGIANQFAVAGRRRWGIGAWFTTALTYPTFALWNAGWDVNQLILGFLGLEPSVQAFGFLAAVVIVILPFFLPHGVSAA